MTSSIAYGQAATISCPTCRPQIEQFLRISQANRLGLEQLAGNNARRADFDRLLQEVKEHDKEALVSKKSARALLTEIEKHFPNKRYELFTSTRSTGNIRLYQNLGYKMFDRKAVTDELQFVYMEKGC